MNVEQEYFFFASFLIGPAPPKPVGNQLLHRPGKIGIDHDRIRAVSPVGRAHAHRAFAGEEDFFNGFVEADFDAQPLGDARHRGGDCGAAANRMKHAVFVFEEAQDAEQARAAERRHAEIFRLKTERKAHPLIGEEALEIGVHGLMRTQHRQHLEQAGLDQSPASRGTALSRHGSMSASLARFSSRKRRKPGASAARRAGDLAVPSERVRSGINVPPAPN